MVGSLLLHQRLLHQLHRLQHRESAEWYRRRDDRAECDRGHWNDATAREVAESQFGIFWRGGSGRGMVGDAAGRVVGAVDAVEVVVHFHVGVVWEIMCERRLMSWN